MPKPTIYEHWRSARASNQPGAFRIVRSLTAGFAAWEEIDIKAVTFGGAADGLAQTGTLDITSKGILRTVNIINTDANNDLLISIHVVGGNPSPASAYLTAYSRGPGIELGFPAELNQSSIYVKGDGVAAAYEAEFWYDVPARPTIGVERWVSQEDGGVAAGEAILMSTCFHLLQLTIQIALTLFQAPLMSLSATLRAVPSRSPYRMQRMKAGAHEDCFPRRYPTILL